MNEEIIIGRDEEKLILQSIVTDIKPDLVAVYGRRRIGKTYLIEYILHKHIIFQFSEIHNVHTRV